MRNTSTPATKQQLDGVALSIRADINDLAGHFTTALGKLGGHVDDLSSHMDEQFLEVNTKLDAIMSGEILVTRKQIQRLITALETQGMKLNVSEILAA